MLNVTCCVLDSKANMQHATHLYELTAMKTVTIFKTLGPIDVKNVQRDSLLLWIPVLPLVMALLMRTAVPWVTALLQAQAAFDLRPYYPLLMSFYIIMAPAISGMVIGFLLLDERDDQILKALMVTPLPLSGYLFYRLSVPIVLGAIMTIIGYPLVQLMPIALGDLLVVSFLAGFVAPIMALFLAIFAENKVAGFAMVKVANSIGILPIVAYFVPAPWHWLGGIVPMFWPMKLVWLIADGAAYGWAAVVGLVANAAAVWLMVRRFRTVVRR